MTAVGCVDENRLSDLLIFVTGLETVPPLGFDPQPSLTFAHIDDVTNISQSFPFANTCSNSLRIPVLPTYAEFNSNFKAAMSMAVTFSAA